MHQYHALALMLLHVRNLMRPQICETALCNLERLTLAVRSVASLIIRMPYDIAHRKQKAHLRVSIE